MMSIGHEKEHFDHSASHAKCETIQGQWLLSLLIYCVEDVFCIIIRLHLFQIQSNLLSKINLYYKPKRTAAEITKKNKNSYRNYEKTRTATEITKKNKKNTVTK